MLGSGGAKAVGWRMGFAEAVEVVTGDEDERSSCLRLLGSSVVGASSSSSPSSLRNGRGRCYGPISGQRFLGRTKRQLTLGPEERSSSLKEGPG